MLIHAFLYVYIWIKSGRRWGGFFFKSWPQLVLLKPYYYFWGTGWLLSNKYVTGSNLKCFQVWCTCWTWLKHPLNMEIFQKWFSYHVWCPFMDKHLIILLTKPLLLCFRNYPLILSLGKILHWKIWFLYKKKNLATFQKIWDNFVRMYINVWASNMV